MGQLIISIGREFGSGGHKLAELLAKHYELPLYDHNLLREVASKMNVNYDTIKQYDEVKKRKIISRTVRGMSSSHEKNIAELQFDFIKEKAKAGESFVVVGRCSESVLNGNSSVISIFVLGDIDEKIERVMKLYNKNKKESVALINAHDKYRKKYHNSHFPGKKWGDSRNYDLCINSSKLGMDATLKIVTDYIDLRNSI